MFTWDLAILLLVVAFLTVAWDLLSEHLDEVPVPEERETRLRRVETSGR